jgi:SAM-dependent methyltransferase
MDNTADSWERAYAEGRIESPLDPHVLELAPTLEIGSALDLGCGAGQNSTWLAELGWSVTGIDVAPSAIALAEQTARDADVSVGFRIGDLTEWSPSRTFDFVFSTYALPPGGTGRTQALAMAAASVSPGGTILVTEFDRSLALDGGWPDRDTTDVDELASHLLGFEIVRIQVETTRHAHGHHEQSYPVVVAIARRETADLSAN